MLEHGDTAGPELKPYTEADASRSLQRAAKLVLIFAVIALPLTLWRGGWPSAALLAVGAAISASGLWEWRRLMAALMARMEQSEADPQPSAVMQLEQSVADQATPEPEETAVDDLSKRPSIGFAIAGFIVRTIVVLAVCMLALSICTAVYSHSRRDSPWALLRSR